MTGAGLALGRLRWFRRRDEATDAEKAQAFQTVASLAKGDDEEGEATYLLGLMTCAGFGTPADPAAAFELQRKAADRDNSDASFELYVHLSTGLGVAKTSRRRSSTCSGPPREGTPAPRTTWAPFWRRAVTARRTWRKRPTGTRGPAIWGTAERARPGSDVRRRRRRRPRCDRAGGLFGVAEELGFNPSAIKDAIGWDEGEG